MSYVYAFKDLYTEVLNNLDETSTSSPTTLTLAKSFINQAHQQRLQMERWPFMEWDTPETFNTLSTGQRTYVLHQEFWRPVYFFNQTIKAYMIEEPDRQLAPTQARWNDQTGHPLQFRLTSKIPVAAQPSSSSTITIVSSAGADNASTQAITIKGVTANGTTSEALIPNGTTPVASVNSYTKLLSVTKAAAWTGNLTMTSNAGAVTNLFLFPTEFGRSYQQIEFLVQPSSVDTIEYKFLRQPQLLVNDEDIPDIPYPHSHILVWDALLLFAGYLTDLSDKSIAMWMKLQTQLDEQIREAYLQGQSLEAEPRYVRYLDGEPNTPRIFTS